MSKLLDDKGFFWWGWHRHYNAHRDVMTGHAGNPHEIHIQQVHWPFLWQVNPQAVSRLYYKGLFRGHPAKPYYESIDDVGDLLSGLLDLHESTVLSATAALPRPVKRQASLREVVSR